MGKRHNHVVVIVVKLTLVFFMLMMTASVGDEISSFYEPHIFFLSIIADCFNAE